MEESLKIKKSKSKDDNLSLFELDELNSMGGGIIRYMNQEDHVEFKSLTILLLLMFIVVMALVSFKKYQEYMNEMMYNDEKKQSFLEFEYQEERASRY